MTACAIFALAAVAAGWLLATHRPRAGHVLAASGFGALVVVDCASGHNRGAAAPGVNPTRPPGAA